MGVMLDIFCFDELRLEEDQMCSMILFLIWPCGCVDYEYSPHIHAFDFALPLGRSRAYVMETKSQCNKHSRSLCLCFGSDFALFSAVEWRP